MVCLVLEFCESGDLATQLSLRQPDNYFPEQHLQVDNMQKVLCPY